MRGYKKMFRFYQLKLTKKNKLILKNQSTVYK